MRVGICGNFTTAFLVDELRKVNPEWEIIVGEFDQYNMEMRDPQGILREIEILLLCLDWRELVYKLYSYAYGDDFQSILGQCREACNAIQKSITAYRALSSAKIVVFSPITDWYSPLGFIDRLSESGLQALFGHLQAYFNQLCLACSDVYPLDLETLSARVGKEQAYDARMHQLARSPFSLQMYSAIAKEFFSFCIQAKNYPLKCIVLDLDNTLWGGIVGEDGLEGLQLGELGLGRAFVEFQTELMRLHRQGIILAICSKNNEDDALEVFDKHPEMMLKLDMISSMRINWEDKPRNIREIARELNIGLDAMMLVDDNPLEREMVRSVLPDVEVLELPSDPALYAETLRRCTRFFPLQLTMDDARKGRFYAEERLRKEVLAHADSVEEYLASSNISIAVRPVEAQALPRVTQLFNKTNQFNLTTKRYTQAELEQQQAATENRLFCLEMSDRFGEYGIIGAVLIIDELIDSFLISCRALGRQVETAFLWTILDHLKKRKYRIARGVHISTGKNAMTSDFYEQFGFVLDRLDGPASWWRFSLDDTLPAPPKWVHIEEGRLE